MPDLKSRPAGLYETLPYLYMGAGVLVALGLRNPWGLASGLLLVAAGALVWAMRRAHRQARSLRRPPTAATDTRAASRCVPLIWRQEYECGHALIDAQHRNLFALGNALLAAIIEKRPKIDLELQIDELIGALTDHFCAEETLLAQSASPLTRQHHEIHHRLLTLSKELSERYHRNELEADALFNFLADEVVAEHVVKEDLKAFARRTD